MNIIDPQGIWLRNNSQFAMHDPEINHLFVPHQAVKIRRSDWAKSQAVIELVPDPLATAPIVAIAKPVVAPVVKKLSPV